MKNRIPEISVFNGNVSTTEPSEKKTIIQFLDDVKLGHWKAVVDRIRSTELEERSNLKQKILPSVTISGVFSKRNSSSLVDYSGFMAIDIDDLDGVYDQVWSLVTKDPFTYAAFKSVGGAGICVIIQVSDPSSHQDHFRWALDHYLAIGNISIDIQCKDIARLRFVSYDPDLYVNYQAKPAGKKKEPKPDRPKFVAPPMTTSQIDRLISEIGANGVNLTENYHEWRQIGMALATEFGEGGREYYHIISSISSKYDPRKSDVKYSDFLANGRGDVKIGTFLHHCKEAGLELYTAEEKQAYAIAKAGVKAKSDIPSVVLAGAQIGLNSDVTREVAEKVFESPEDHGDSNSDSIVSDIASFIQFNCDLEFNSITQKVENKGVPINDRFLNSIYLKAKQTISDKVTKSDVAAIIESEMIKEYCPIQKWVDQHSHLPHKPEVIDTLLETIPYKHPKSRLFIKHWLLGIPATYHGEIVRLVLVLCGSQETGKTWWFRELIPKGLKHYYAESGLDDDYNAAVTMSSNIITMDDEFGGKSKKDASKFKEFTSKAIFDVRLKHARLMTTMRRLSMLCGTSNETEILNDTTGNTRILPVEFHQKYNYDLYNSIDKDQLFIELFRAYDRGESWQLSDEAKKCLENLNQDHSIADIAAELVDMYLEKDSSMYPNYMTTTEIKATIEKMSQQRLAVNKLGEVLKLNFGTHRKRINGKQKRVYPVKWKTGNMVQDSVQPEKEPF